MQRLVSLDKCNNLILRIGNRWYRGLEAERRATKAERIRADWLRTQQETELPLFDGELYYWPNDPAERYAEVDVVCDLKAIFGFSEADALAVCESSRGMYCIKQFIND